MVKPVVLVVFSLFSLLLSAQQAPAYPQDYFRNPMGIPLELTANFGELRANHWHMGLDIRTRQKENLPVYAAAAGYIAKIGIRPQSFGRFIIIQHPNGLSTLYGHLNDFYPELEAWVTGQQYRQESWAVELELTPDQFPVSKGSFIAYSGNTGGSQGPHLHFEIFVTQTGKRLNPLLFGLPVPDKVPPVLVRLAMYDGHHSVYDQTPRFYPLKKTDSGYVIPKIPVIKTGLSRLRFALQMYDQLSGSKNPNGVYAATLYMDEQPQVQFVLDSVDYTETGYLNAHVDYRLKYNGGGWLQQLSVMPGDPGTVYQQFNGQNGLIQLSDTTLHQLSVAVTDAQGNLSELRFAIQFNDSMAAKHLPVPAVPHFAPGQAMVFKRTHFRAAISPGSLYDSVRIVYNQGANPSGGTAVTALHQLNDPSVPVHDPITVWLKPVQRTQGYEDKLVIVRSYKGSRSVRKAELDNGWLTARFGDFGYFQGFIDTIPPSIGELGKGDTVNLSAARQLQFTPTDNSGIQSFRAELNGRWLRFTNDKSRSWIYRFDEQVPYGVYQLRVTVEDLAGNTSTKSWWFKRGPYTPPPKKKAVKKKPVQKKTVPVSKKRTT